MKKNLILLSVCMLILSSCGSIKDFRYFQDTSAGDVNQVTNALQAVTIKPYDKISVVVTCRDPQISTMFNLVSTSNRVGQTTTSSSG